MKTIICNVLPLSYGERERRVRIVVRVLPSHLCGAGFISPRVIHICLHVNRVCHWFLLCFKGFSLGSLVFISPEKPTLPNYISIVPAVTYTCMASSQSSAIHLFIIFFKGFSCTFSDMFSHMLIKDLLKLPSGGKPCAIDAWYVHLHVPQYVCCTALWFMEIFFVSLCSGCECDININNVVVSFLSFFFYFCIVMHLHIR